MIYLLIFITLSVGFCLGFILFAMLSVAHNCGDEEQRQSEDRSYSEDLLRNRK